MYRIGVLTAFIFVGGIALCQEEEVSIFKLWSEDNLLQWEDYTITHEKRFLKTGFLVDAVTSYQYKFIPGDWDVYDCINVATLFVRGNSWIADTIDHSILEHERLHFDIAELYARKLRKELYILFKTKNENYETYHLMLDSLFKAGRVDQEVYDQETFYGQMKNVQQIWKDHITYELQQLEDFSFYNVMHKCNKDSP